MVKETRQVVLLDDNLERRASLKTLFTFAGEEVIELGRREAIPTGKAQNIFAVVLCVDAETNLNASAIERTVSSIAENFPELPMIMITEKELHPLIAQQHDYRIFKKVTHPICYPQVVDLIHQCESFRKNNKKRTASSDKKKIKQLVGSSQAIKDIREQIGQCVDSTINVLIRGESGVGKEIVARNIHMLSPRSKKPFVAVNCGAIPAELLESELFGHEKGAFTGATSRREGRFEKAKGGTLFLDEIGDMPLSMQVKILRVLQEKVFERVGGNELIMADVRIIAATHCDLETAIQKKRFREDLYYRLNVFPIDLPPLRKRKEDISLLIQDILMELEAKHQKKLRLSTNTMHVLENYRWPGNVRELVNLLERLMVQYGGRIVDANDLPEQYRPKAFTEKVLSAPVKLPAGQFDLKSYLQELEVSLIEQALREEGGVVARAADRLRIGRTTLVEKMKKYRIQRPGDASNRAAR